MLEFLLTFHRNIFKGIYVDWLRIVATEELFFHGYIVQGASLAWTNRIFLALVPAAIFALSHLLNPEASAGGWLTGFFNYFLVPGLVWTVVSLIDGTTELAIGAHFANNISGVLLFNVAGSVLNART